MIVKRLLQLNLLVCVLTAVTFIAFPDSYLSFFGISGDDGFRTFAQYFGTMHVAFAVLLFLALRSNDPRFLRMIVASFFIGDLTGSAVLLVAQLRGAMNTMGWSGVAISVFFAIGYGYGVFRKLPQSE